MVVVTQTGGGTQEALQGVRKGLTGQQETRLVIYDGTHPFNVFGLSVTSDVQHPWSEGGTIIFDLAHEWNAGGILIFQVQHPYREQTPPRNWGPRLGQRSSRIVITRTS